MKNLKVRQLSSGFMLMEAVIAVAIMALLLTPILLLQYNVFKRVTINKQKIEHLFPTQAFFFSLLINPLPKNQTSQQEHVDDPLMNLKYEISEAMGESARFKNLYFETV